MPFGTGKLEKLGQLRSQELASGLRLDQFEISGILWKDGNNITFTSHGVAKTKGYSALLTPIGTTPVRGMVDVTVSLQQKLYWGDQTNLYESIAGANPTSVGSGFTGSVNATATTPATAWSMVNFGSWILATNGVDAPQILKTTSFAPLTTDSQFNTAQIFIVRGPHVLAFNTNFNEKEFLWSDADDPETWAPTAENAAGSLIVRELEGQIMAAAPLGNRIAVYGKDQMFLVNFTGAPFFFGYQPALSSIGAVSKMCVVPRGRFNYGLSRQGFWETDGVNFRYIDSGLIGSFVQDNLNWAQASKVTGLHDEENSQVVWYVPTSTGEPDTYLAFDYDRNLWSKGSTSFTTAIPREVFTNPVAADVNGGVFFLNFGNDADGVALPANARTTAVDLGQPDLVKELTALRVGYIGTGLRVRVGTAAEADGTITWGNFIEVPNGFEFIPLRQAGRYLFLDFDSQDLGDKWEVQAVDFHGLLGGTR